MNEEEIKKEFEKIWKKISEMENKIEGKKEIKVEEENSNILENEISIFCRNSGIDEEKLKEKVDFHENLPKLVILSRDDTRTKLQSKVLISLAPLCYRIYNKNLSENIVRELFKLNRIPTERLDKLYQSPNFKNNFSKSKTNITLKWAGEQEGIKKLKELIENETNTAK